MLQPHARTIAAAAALYALAGPVLAQGAMKTTETLVINPTSRPVPVTVLSPPAQPGEGGREIYGHALTLVLGGGIKCSDPQIVPAGKRLVLQHVSGHTVLPAGAALVFVGIGSQAGARLDVIVPATPPMNSVSVAGQQVHVYLDDQFEICAQATGLPFAIAAFVSLRGYLVNKP